MQQGDMIRSNEQIERCLQETVEEASKSIMDLCILLKKAYDAVGCHMTDDLRREIEEALE